MPRAPRAAKTLPLVATRSANPVSVYNTYVLTYIYIYMCIHTYVQKNEYIQRYA